MRVVPSMKINSVPLLSAESLEDLTFKNLIITERGGKIVTALLFELMSSLSFDTSYVQELCHDLQLRCPMFFSSFTGKLVVGDVYLSRAANIGSDRPRERQDLLDAALEEYVRATEELENAPDLHSISIIEDACDKFQALKFYDGVLVLMFSAAHHVARGRTKHVPDDWESVTGALPEDASMSNGEASGMNNVYGSQNLSMNAMTYGYNSPMQRNRPTYSSPLRSDTRANGGANGGLKKEEKNSLNLRKRMYNRVLRVLDNLIFHKTMKTLVRRNKVATTQRYTNKTSVNFEPCPAIRRRVFSQ